MNKVQKQIQKKMLDSLGIDENPKKEIAKRNPKDSLSKLSSSEKRQLENKLRSVVADL